MCEFCETGDITEICKRKISFGVLGNVELTIDMSENYIYANLLFPNIGCIELKEHISYCSKCGRKLSEVE